jgi:hypothetical protein
VEIVAETTFAGAIYDDRECVKTRIAMHRRRSMRPKVKIAFWAAVLCDAIETGLIGQ